MTLDEGEGLKTCADNGRSNLSDARFKNILEVFFILCSDVIDRGVWRGFTELAGKELGVRGEGG